MCEYTLAVGSGQCRIGVGVGVGVGVGGCAVLGVRPERGTGMVKGRRGQGDGGRWGGLLAGMYMKLRTTQQGPIRGCRNRFAVPEKEWRTETRGCTVSAHC